MCVSPVALLMLLEVMIKTTSRCGIPVVWAQGSLVCIPDSLQIVLCENKIYSQGCMNDTLTHELVHAFDHCRAHLDWNNLHHLACTEVGHALSHGKAVIPLLL